MSLGRIKHCEEISAQPTLPDASKYTWIFDSTRLGESSGGRLGKTDALPTVGLGRGGAKNTRITITAAVTTTAATLVRYRLDGAGAWKLYASTTLNAGDTPQAIVWDVASPDCLIGILAGATPPTAIQTTCLIKEQP